MFEQSFVNRNQEPARKASIAASFFMQVAVVLGLVVLPVVFVEDLPGIVLAATLQTPEPPPPPPKYVAAANVQPVPVRQFNDERLLAPKNIPDEIAIVVDEAPPEFTGPVGAANPYGVGVPERCSIIGSFLVPVTPPPPKPVEPEPEVIQRVRVGGIVELPSPLSTAQPVYPRLAIQARIEGEVLLEAVIGADGRVRDVKVLSGHPLLIPAATEAVRRWIYQPTTLNGNPVEVVMTVTVRFRLTQ